MFLWASVCYALVDSMDKDPQSIRWRAVDEERSRSVAFPDTSGTEQRSGERKVSGDKPVNRAESWEGSGLGRGQAASRKAGLLGLVGGSLAVGALLANGQWIVLMVTVGESGTGDIGALAALGCFLWALCVSVGCALASGAVALGVPGYGAVMLWGSGTGVAAVLFGGLGWVAALGMGACVASGLEEFSRGR